MARSLTRTARVARSVRYRRKRRKGEHVCDCQAYDFPHRFGGGACSGRAIVVKQWNKGGWNKTCVRCHARDATAASCQVLEGQESVDECPAWQSYVASHEIRVSRSRLRALARSPRRLHISTT